MKDKLPHTVQTSGWVRVVAVNDTTALVSPEHTCGDIRAGDFLEPFVAPIVQEGDDDAARAERAELRAVFESAARRTRTAIGRLE